MSEKMEDLSHVADIVAAFVSNNALPQAELAGFIAKVHRAFHELIAGPTKPAEAPPLAPAVSVKKSVTDDFIICLEDGLKFKSLKRHLATKYNLTPDAYRAKWGLPRDYPMVAPTYAAVRSGLAKAAGLGAKKDPAKRKPAAKVTSKAA